MMEFHYMLGQHQANTTANVFTDIINILSTIKTLNITIKYAEKIVADLAAAMAITADYLITETEFRNPSDYTPELSRRARGIDVWAALRSLGRNGVEQLVDRCCRHARRFADRFKEAGFEVLNDVVLNQVLVSFGDDAATRDVIDAIQRDGTCWCGATVWQDKTAMRISVSSWATTDEDVEKSLGAMIPIAQRLSDSGI